MIWTNGYIKLQTSPTSIVFDEVGNPIEQECEWSDFVPCHYVSNIDLTATTSENSDYCRNTYTIRCKLQPSSERVQIYNKAKEKIGEFVVKSINHYEYIDETHIVC